MGNVVTAQSSILGYLVRSGIESFSVRKPKSKHEKSILSVPMLADALAYSMTQLQKFYSILSILTLFLNVLSDLFKYSITFEIRTSLVLHTKVYRIVYLCTHITYIISFLFSWHFLIFCLFSLSFPLGKLVPQYNLMYTVFLCVDVSFALLHILMLKHLIHSLECYPVT